MYLFVLDLESIYVFITMAEVQYIIGIGGGSGSGKTTFARELSNRFKPSEVTWLSQDHYYHPLSEQYVDENGVENFDLVTAIDTEKYLSDIVRLQNGESLHLTEYVFNNDKKDAQMITINPAPVLIVEGLFIYALDSLRENMDLRLFVSASDHKMLIRRLKRDGIERNYPPEDVIYRWENHVWPAYQKYIYPYRDETDIIINNNQEMNVSLEVITTFISSKLKELWNTEH